MRNKRLIIFDRDGCLNQKKQLLNYVYRLEDFSIYQDVIPFLKLGNQAGINFAVATNQQGISKNLYTRKDVNALHRHLIDLIGIKNLDFPIFTCPHLEEMHCKCRKPKPGLLIQALEYFDIDKKDAIFIGDTDSDWEAAKAIELDFLFIERESISIDGHSKTLKDLTEILFERV